MIHYDYVNEDDSLWLCTGLPMVCSQLLHRISGCWIIVFKSRSTLVVK